MFDTFVLIYVSPGMTFIGAEVTFEFLNVLQGNLLKGIDNKFVGGDFGDCPLCLPKYVPFSVTPFTYGNKMVQIAGFFILMSLINEESRLMFFKILPPSSFMDFLDFPTLLEDPSQ